MRCIIPGRFIKLFGRAIHCLSKIGDELFFEALQNGLALRTVNSSRSAYASFVFSQAFFFEYLQESDTIDDSNPETLLKCKLTMKSCLAIFKSLANIDKTVEQCKIEFQPDKCRLVFVLYCKHGITKTHNLTFQECERLEAVYQKELCPNLILAQSKVLLDTVINFPSNCDEITLTVSPESVKVTNYVSDEPDPTKIVYTEMSLVPEEFDNFQIGVDTQVTFCLKELRAVLAFSEFVNQPLSIHFEHAGKPIVLSLGGDDLYECNFVMATLSESNDVTQTQQTTQQQSGNTANKHNTNEKLSKKKSQFSKNTVEMNMTAAASFLKTAGHKKSSSVAPLKHTKTRASHEQAATKTRASPEQAVPRTKNILNNQSTNITNSDEEFFSESFPYKDMLVPNIPKENHSQRTTLNTSILRNSVPVCETSIDLTALDDDEVLLNTPPVAKKFKSSMFFGSDEKKNEKPKQSKVLLLAADTDDEED